MAVIYIFLGLPPHISVCLIWLDDYFFFLLIFNYCHWFLWECKSLISHSLYCLSYFIIFVKLHIVSYVVHVLSKLCGMPCSPAFKHIFLNFLHFSFVRFVWWSGHTLFTTFPVFQFDIIPMLFPLCVFHFYDFSGLLMVSFLWQTHSPPVLGSIVTCNCPTHLTSPSWLFGVFYSTFLINLEWLPISFVRSFFMLDVTESLLIIADLVLLIIANSDNSSLSLSLICSPCSCQS